MPSTGGLAGGLPPLTGAPSTGGLVGPLEPSALLPAPLEGRFPIGVLDPSELPLILDLVTPLVLFIELKEHI